MLKQLHLFRRKHHFFSCEMSLTTSFKNCGSFAHIKSIVILNVVFCEHISQSSSEFFCDLSTILLVYFLTSSLIIFVLDAKNKL